MKVPSLLAKYGLAADTRRPGQKANLRQGKLRSVAQAIGVRDEVWFGGFEEQEELRWQVSQKRERA